MDAMQAMKEGKNFTISKPWVGLTDEEINYYIVHSLGVATKKNLVGLIRLCEDKLKQKNGFAEEKNA